MISVVAAINSIHASDDICEVHWLWVPFWHPQPAGVRSRRWGQPEASAAAESPSLVVFRVTGDGSYLPAAPARHNAGRGVCCVGVCSTPPNFTLTARTCRPRPTRVDIFFSTPVGRVAI